MDIPRILIKIRPDAVWNLNGNTFEGIDWLDKIQPKPTLAEIKAAEAGVLADIAAEQAEKQAIVDTIATTLPSLAAVETAINNISNLAEAKVFLWKLSKVVYHHIKGTTNGG